MVNDRSVPGAQVRLELLRSLEAAGGQSVSGGMLGRRLNVSRTSVWKHVQALRRLGYGIESAPRRGYRLVSSPDSLNSLEVRGQLRAGILGREIHCFSSLGSTQDMAFRLAQKGAPEGTLVVAEEQTGGRGRLGRSFFSPKGGLWFSLVLRPSLQPQACLPLSLMAGVAVSRAVGETTGLPAKLKWPNDVLIQERKVAGILSEIVAETDVVRFVVCGVGLNVNVALDSFPVELRPLVTSLSMELGHEVPRLPLLCRIVESIDRCYQELLSSGPQAVLEAWRGLPNMLGRQVRLTSQGETVEGTATGLDSQGALMVRTSDGIEKRIVSGDVYLVNPEGSACP